MKMKIYSRELPFEDVKSDQRRGLQEMRAALGV